MNIVPRIFIGSSKESLPLAQTIADELRKQRFEIVVWDNSFGPSRPTIVQLVNFITRFDFGVFIFSPDDELRIREEEKKTVRDNVVLEAGIFLGGLGIDRTFIVKVKTARSRSGNAKQAQKRPVVGDRQPTDLDGFVTLAVEQPEANVGWEVGPAVESIRLAVDALGPAIRNSYNEVQLLRTVLNERVLRVKKRKRYVLGDLVREAASARAEPWITISDPLSLMEKIVESGVPPKIVDDAYWWLVVEGVYIFQDPDHFTSNKSWHWRESIPYVKFSDRGVALLNEYRHERSSPKKARAHR